jgi:two-component system, sensor histidine kinase and response regulator
MILQDKNIFIVEDDSTNLAIISALLRRNGATILFDRWGIDTITRIQRAKNIDIILMDLMLPNGVTGYDVFDSLKTVPSLATIPVVMVSAADPTLEMNRARTKGFMGFISKPINHRKFPTYIAQIIEGIPLWGETYTEED